MRRTDLTGDVATAAFAAAFGGLVWSAGSALSVPEVDRAIPVLLVLGGLAIWRPEPVLEVSAAIGRDAGVAGRGARRHGHLDARWPSISPWPAPS